MTPEHFEYTPTRADFMDYVKAVAWRLSAARHPSMAARTLRLMGGAAIGLVLFFAFVSADKFCSIPGEPCSLEPFSVFVGAIVSFALVFALVSWLNLRNAKAMVTDGSAYLSPVRMTLLSDRLETFGPSIRCTYDWDAFEEVTTAKRTIILWVDRGVGVYVPRTTFVDAETENAFVTACRTMIEAARGDGDPET